VWKDSIMPGIGISSCRLTSRFVLGTSSSLFNQALLYLPSNNETTAQKILENTLQSISANEEDIAWYPNPFKDVNSSNNVVAPDQNLALVDGVPFSMKTELISRAKTNKTSPYGLFFRKNGT
jgi:hypothetical protein